MRLAPESLHRLAAGVRTPRYDRAALRIGQVHLGVGAFMRAHTAVYTEDAIEASGGDWGIAGVSLRNATVRSQLAPQDCLYTVAERDGRSAKLRLIGALRSMHVAPEDPAAVVRLLAEPAIRIVTLTVTEKGYGLSPDSGALDTLNPDIARDLLAPDRPRSTLGFLVAGLAGRQQTAAPPVTIVSCDNLPDNGARLEHAVRELARRVRPELGGWIDDNVRFPSTVVDRIVPATTEDDLESAARTLGVTDAAHVKTEPFRQWVIEDAFAGERPAFERAGALLVPDVAPYEAAKLRLLNGAHSAIAYLGCLAGYRYVHEAMQDRHFAAWIRRLMTTEISPVTPAPDGMAHGPYIAALLERFGNASLAHRTRQIAMDGSQKLPQRLLDTVRAELARSGPIDGLALAVAAWMRYALGRDEQGKAIDVDDPLSGRFADIAARCGDSPRDAARAFLALTDVFGTDLAGNERFTLAVTRQLAQLFEQGARKTVARQASGEGAQ